MNLTQTMKTKTITTLLAVFAGLLTFTALPQKAQAGHGHSSRRIDHNCGHCQRPVYSYRVIAYYDSCGRPFYRWVPQSHSGCGSRSQGYPSYGYPSHSYPSYGYRPAPRPSYGGGYYYRGEPSCRPGSRFSFSWGF
jgi:hypothetical protein